MHIIATNMPIHLATFMQIWQSCRSPRPSNTSFTTHGSKDTFWKSFVPMSGRSMNKYVACSKAGAGLTEGLVYLTIYQAYSSKEPVLSGCYVVLCESTIPSTSSICTQSIFDSLTWYHGSLLKLCSCVQAEVTLFVKGFFVTKLDRSLGFKIVRNCLKIKLDHRSQ